MSEQWKAQGQDLNLEDLTFELAEGCDLDLLMSQARQIEPGVALVKRRSIHWEGVTFYLSWVLLAAALFASGLVRQGLGFAAWACAGWPVVAQALRNLGRGAWRDEFFLMTLATVGAIALGESLEAASVMVFYGLGERIERRALSSSRQALSSVTALRPEEAIVEREGAEVKVHPRDLEVGSIFLVKPGSRFPLDGVVVKGQSTADTACMTGESLPQNLSVGDEVVSGTVNLTSSLWVRATSTYDTSAAAKVLELMGRGAADKAPFERLITRFAAWYTPAVVCSALLIGLSPLVHGGTWAVWVHRALVFLVLSCPCALLVSVPLTLACGVGAASRHGLVVKGATALERLASVKVAAFDKTGTLTQGRLHLAGGDLSAEHKALLLGLEAHSAHPLALALREAWSDVTPAPVDQVREEAGLGLVGTGVSGQGLAAGRKELMERLGFEIGSQEASGTELYFACGEELFGPLTFADRVKEEAASALGAMASLGVKERVVLSGDRQEVVDKLVATLPLTDGKGGLLPADKVAWVEKLSHQGPLLFVGDGMNDSPALARAAVSAAMGGLGSDAAVSAADVVVMNDQLSALVLALQIARRTLAMAKGLVFFALAVKAVVGLCDLWGLVPMWLAVFADVGVTVVAVAFAASTLRFCPQKHKNCLCHDESLRHKTF